MAYEDHPDSWYAATAIDPPELPPLAGEERCDVCVIGGGFTGLSAALNLAERGYDTVLLEGRRVGWGASGRNGGQIGTGQRKGQGDLEAELGRDDARKLWDLFLEARNELRERVKRHEIPCDLTDGGLTAASKAKHADGMRRYADKLREEYDYPHIRFVDRDEVRGLVGSPNYHGGLMDDQAGHVHPLNLALGLARAARDAGARLYEQTPATGYDAGQPTTVRTAAGGSVKADWIVLACNGYLGRLEKRLAGRIMPINNYVIATEPLGEERARGVINGDFCVHDTKFVVDYYRLTPDRRLLFGGGESYSSRFPADIAGFVHPVMARAFPQLADVRIDHAWGGTLAITMTRMPHFGRLEPNILFAQGYSGHGVTLASFAGRLIAEALAGTAERFDLMAKLKTPVFPGGTLLRWPGLVAGMLYYSLRDRL